MICLTRRVLLQTAAMGALLSAARPALAQAWPDHPLRFVVPAAPGAGGTSTSWRG
jgi:tripartite-type tricarboxylate transporter receptor subunit TctC